MICSLQREHIFYLGRLLTRNPLNTAIFEWIGIHGNRTAVEGKSSRSGYCKINPTKRQFCIFCRKIWIDIWIEFELFWNYLHKIGAKVL